MTLPRVGLIPNLLGLGLFWGLSPIFTKYLAMMHVSPFMTISFSGFGVGIGLFIVWRVIGKVELANWSLWLFGAGCAVLLNLPFAISLVLIGHVSVGTFSIITSTTPLFGYAIAVVIGIERLGLARAMAILCGFGGSALLLIDPDALHSAEGFPTLDLYTLACFGLPLFYALYHVYASHFWPKGAETSAVSIAESLLSGVLFLPFLVIVDGPSGWDIPPMAMIALGAITLLWVVERITFFNLIRHFGPISTVQAVNLATFSAILLGHYLFDEPIDARIVVSGVLVLMALWLNAKAEEKRLLAESLA